MLFNCTLRESGKPILLNSAHIVSVYPEYTKDMRQDGSSIVMVGGQTWYIRESLDTVYSRTSDRG